MFSRSLTKSHTVGDSGPAIIYVFVTVKAILKLQQNRKLFVLCNNCYVKISFKSHRQNFFNDVSSPSILEVMCMGVVLLCCLLRQHVLIQKNALQVCFCWLFCSKSYISIHYFPQDMKQLKIWEKQIRKRKKKCNIIHTLNWVKNRPTHN